MISQLSIQRIIEESRVEEVIGEHVSLKKRGANYIGLCPFHHEKTPSFIVSPSKNIFKCFGCGKAGNAVTFLMEHAQMNYVEALKYLAKKYNIEIEETTQQTSDEEQEKQKLAESILVANSFAQKFFTDYLLHTEKGKIGLSYFLERGYDKKIIEKFQLGFAPADGDTFARHALSNAFNKDILSKAGLISSNESHVRDFFRNRVIFPIHHTNGKILGFAGRVLAKNDSSPKYINTPENEVYIKSKILYGAYFARQAIRKMDECLLVEGYTDVISLHQAGIENVMASGGTSLTTEQIRLIKRLTNNITILYDGDQAGIKAALRGTDMILEEGLNVRVVMLPDGEDPDSFAQKFGAERTLQYIQDNKQDIISFKTNLFAKETANDPIKRSELIREILNSIARIPDPMQRAIYCKECSQHFQINEQIIVTEVNKLRRNLASKDTPHVAPLETNEQKKIQSIHGSQLETTTNTIAVLEEHLMRIFLEYGDWKIYLSENEYTTVTEFLFEELEGIEIETPDFLKLFQLIKQNCSDGKILPVSHYLSLPDEEIQKCILQIVSEKYAVSENWWNKYKIVVPEKKHFFIKDIESTVVRIKQYHNL
ncbi:MAG: DNA primase, partial [Chitinophagales bacterium]|nr:DNA primase [Chitinophagales bacterium]